MSSLPCMLMRWILLLSILGLSIARAAEPEAIPRFDILEFTIEGNTKLPTVRIEEAVYPYLGEKKTIADVEAARGALEKAYHDAGYLTVLVHTPEQKVEGGLVRLKVVEGSVARLKVTGSRFFSLSDIKAQATELNEGKVPHFPTMQKQLAALNRSQDRRVTPVLRPAKTPGQTEVELKVQDEFPLHGEVSLDNRYSANTSKTRLSGNLRYANLWQKQHSLGLGFQIAPENSDDAAIISATYLMPAGKESMFALYGVAFRSNVAAAAGDIRVLGDGKIVGLRWVEPLPTKGGVHHFLSMGGDYKDFKEDLQFGGGGFKTPISYLPFNVEYRGQQGDEAAKTLWNLGWTFSLRGVADKTIECIPGFSANEFECKRFGAKANFNHLRGGLKHERGVGGDFRLNTRLEFQLTDQPLISNEQFSAGGAQSVRGYTESAALGDRGMVAGLETLGPSLKLPDGFALRPLAFLESGLLRVVDPLPAQQDKFELASAGLGLRLTSKQGLSSDLDLAWPRRTLGDSKKGEPKLHWRLGHQW